MYLDFARRCAAFAALACCTLQLSAADKPKVPPYYAEQPATEHLDLTMYQRIREEGFAHSHVMEFASALMDGIGPRLTGSPNMKKANEWTRDTLTKIGLQNAHLEDWGEFGIGWQQINSWARIITPDTEPLWLQAAPWSPATKGPITGDVVHLAIATDADLDAAITKYKGKLSGKIVLFGIMRPVPDITAPLFSRYTDEELKEMEGSEQATPRVPRPGAPTPAERLRTAALRAKALKMMTDEGVAVILTPSRDGNKGGGAGIIFDDNNADLVRGAQNPANRVTVPNAVLTIEGYGRLVRLLAANVPVKLEVNLESTTTGDHEHGFNTVAEIPGSDPKLKEQVVMVGGHLDSWISGTGATDNGAGSVVAMEAVRILKALDLHPRRTIRIALWSGEEQGLYGSKGYVKQHFGEFEEKSPASDPGTGLPRQPTGPLKTTKEWETLDAYYNLDNGTGRVRGVYLQGNYAIGPIFKQWLAPLADLSATTLTPRDTGGTDHLSFDAVGLPGFQFIQDPMDYETRTHHSNMDTVERLHPADLMQAAVIEAIFLYNTSEREEMMPRKPFPHPELNRERNAPLKDIFPNAVEPAGKPGTPTAQ
ncbi:M20/M25/M40 family metallo-hydrolase [Terriglobus saanensis]|uniref:Carboxypeptidase Q n=1 Tax=Terriglobus saanensis (strain ATCC BAA-1853 / DSM 23119 / SP1PR4) TaxID=401053 RepID=E8V681_TERSS|nr:M20/M25/M40 family metallo-hydrolase [Terriglobus saanensis]ADV84972.1 peptidase M28 [Terriglobus saanensis SP1PR4]